MQRVDLSEKHRGWLIREQLIAPAAINFALNAGIAWLLFRGRGVVPLWGEAGIAVDALATLFLLPFCTCLIVTPLVRRAVRVGKVPPLDAAIGLPQVIERLPRALLARAAALGLGGVVAGAPVVLGAVAFAGGELAVPTLVLSKGVYTGALAALIGPMIALRALAEPRGPSTR
jgi:hypothetical protein